MTFVDSQSHLFRTLKVFGFISLKLERKYLSKIYLIIVNSILFAFMFFQILNFIDIMVNHKSNHPIFVIFYLFQNLASIINLMSMILHSSLAQSKFKEFFGKLKEIEFELKLCESIRSLRRTSCFIFCIIYIETLFANFLFISLILFSPNTIYEKLKMFLIHTAFQFSLLYCDSVLIFIVMILKSLSAYFRITENINFDKLRFFKFFEKMKEIVNDFSKTFGIIILTCVFYIFWMTAIDYFFGFYEIFFRPDDINIYEFFSNFATSLFLVPNMTLIFLIGQECTEVKNSYIKALQKYKSNKRIKKTRKYFEEILQIDCDNDLQFTTHGFYVVDSSLFFKVNINFIFFIKILKLLIFFQMFISMLSTLMIAIQFYQMSIID